MTEAEYIAATNLAKLRLAHHALYDVLLLKADEAIGERGRGGEDDCGLAEGLGGNAHDVKPTEKRGCEGLLFTSPPAQNGIRLRLHAWKRNTP